MMIVLAALMTYAQLESLWIHAGGAASLAPTMAAVAVAESHPLGDAHHARMGLMNYDRHELGGSFCGWQVNLVHTTQRGGPFDRDRLSRDPLYCARAAVYVALHQGLDAWTTHREGTFLSYISRETPAPERTARPRVTPQQFLAYVRAFHHAPPKNWQPHDLTEAQIAHMRVDWTTTPYHAPRGGNAQPEALNAVQIVLCGLVAILLVQAILRILARAFRADAEAEEAYRRRTRRRAYEGRALRRRVPA